MKKFLIAEVIISAIYTAIVPHLWKGAVEYVGALIGSMIVPLGIGYIVAVCITRKSPRIHKIAFIVFCVLIAMAGCQTVYEIQTLKEKAYAQGVMADVIKESESIGTSRGPRTQMEKDLRENIIEVDKATADYDTNTTPEQIEKEMQIVADGLIKTMVQEMMARAKKIHVPEPMLQNTSFLYSKEKLDAAIRKQDADIKRYKKEINAAIEDMMQGSADAALASCEKSYTKIECEKLKKPFERGLGEAKNKIYSAVPVYVSYIEEELNAMRFISNHYNSFTTSGQFPHFTDAALQKQFMAKIQEVDRKGRAVADLRNNAWQDAHNKVSRI